MLVITVLLLAAWWGLSILKPFSTTSSDWLQVASNFVIAYAVTKVINNEGKKKELLSLLLDQIENALDTIEKQIETCESTQTDVHKIIIPQFKAVTTRITAFKGELSPKWYMFGKDCHSKIIKSLGHFNEPFFKLRTIISENPDEFTVSESDAIRLSYVHIRDCRTGLWKVKFIVFS